MTKINKGYALIASPKLKDDPFRRSVIYLTQCDSRSAVGFIMNRPTKLLLGQFFPQVKQAVRLYSGGPVESGMLYFIHDIPHLLPESIPIRGGVFWGGQFETLLELLAQGDVSPANVRFFLVCGTVSEQSRYGRQKRYVDRNAVRRCRYGGHNPGQRSRRHRAELKPSQHMYVTGGNIARRKYRQTLDHVLKFAHIAAPYA